MGTVDFSALKMKVIASIAAISAIDLLKRFFAIADVSDDPARVERELYWLVVVHLTFVMSGVLMTLTDWLTARAGKH